MKPTVHHPATSEAFGLLAKVQHPHSTVKFHAGLIIVKSRREHRLLLPLMQHFCACCLEWGTARMSVFHSLNVIIGRQQELSGVASALLVTQLLKVRPRLWLRLGKSLFRRRAAF